MAAPAKPVNEGTHVAYVWMVLPEAEGRALGQTARLASRQGDELGARFSTVGDRYLLSAAHRVDQLSAPGSKFLGCCSHQTMSPVKYTL
ncbi:MAG: hypothetical protein A2V83_03580 [Nitrospirae bacterium RBG_16_64_22]|nr:MAG: hypothetical protein A2V83_03580 [Nitrospirae bacterium RBG_16_64_22]